MMSFGDVTSSKSTSKKQRYSNTTSKLISSLNKSLPIYGMQTKAVMKINVNSPRDGIAPNLERTWTKKRL